MEFAFNKSSVLKYEGNFAALSNGWNCGVAVKFAFIFALAFTELSLHVAVELTIVGDLRKFFGIDFSVI